MIPLRHLPNLITILRILLVPVLVLLLRHPSHSNAILAALTFFLASWSDFLDGYLARRHGITSTLGKLLDPLADKLIVMAALVMLVHLGRVAAWVVIVVMAREFIVTGLRTIAMSEGIVIAAGQEGKHKASFQVVGITFLLLHYGYPVDAGLFTFEFDANRVGTILLVVSIFFSVWSMVDYFVGFIRAVYRPPGGPGEGA